MPPDIPNHPRPRRHWLQLRAQMQAVTAYHGTFAVWPTAGDFLNNHAGKRADAPTSSAESHEEERS